MSDQINLLKSLALVGCARPVEQGGRGVSWWFNCAGGEFGKNHFEHGIPEDMARKLVKSCTPGLRKIAVLQEDGETIDFVSQEWVAVLIDAYAKGKDPKNLAYMGRNSFGSHDPEKLLLDPLLALCSDNSGLVLSSVVVSRNGALVSVQISQDVAHSAAGMDFKTALMGATAHDGSMQSMLQDTEIRIVCDNTQAAAIGRESSDVIKIKHTAKSEARVQATVDEVHDRLGQLAKARGLRIEKLASIPVSERQFFNWLDKFCPEEPEMIFDKKLNKERRNRAFARARKRRNDLVEMYRQDRRCAPWQGTALGIEQTVSTYFQHEAGVRGADRLTRQIDNFWSGKQQSIETLALKQLEAVLA